jgi:hypothetical protein
VLNATLQPLYPRERPGTQSPFKAELEKKRGVQSIDIGKKLARYKSFLRDTSIVSNKRKIAKEDPFAVEKIGPSNL